MSCNTCGGNSCACGPVRISPVYPSCPSGEPCDSTMDFACVRYRGDDLADFPLANGDRLSRFMQMLVLREISPTAFAGVDTVRAPYWIESTGKTDTTIDFEWDDSGTPYDWTISYSTNNSTWTDITGVANTKDSYQLTNLTANTKYYIKVAGVGNGGSPGPFYSVTIEVTTNE